MIGEAIAFLKLHLSYNILQTGIRINFLDVVLFKCSICLMKNFRVLIYFLLCV